eukprot:m.128273 g.128273  ORF g.128273 m.128273 type:complete len:73 (+) comp17425_c0_seq2:2374-2592(+)
MECHSTNCFTKLSQAIFQFLFVRVEEMDEAPESVWDDCDAPGQNEKQENLHGPWSWGQTFFWRKLSQRARQI